MSSVTEVQQGTISAGYEVLSSNGEKFIFSDKKLIPRTREEMAWAVENEYVIPAFRDNALSVDLMLDYVDLKLEWYIPSLDAIKFINFIRLCIGGEPENLNSMAHYFFIDAMFGSDSIKPYYDVRGIDFDEMSSNALILSTREFSKSIISVYFILYMAATGEKPNFGKVRYGIYVSDNMKGNVKTTMETIQMLYMGSEYLKSVFEEVHFTQEYFWAIRNPSTKNEIKIFNNAMRKGLDKKEVPRRSERKFKLTGLGCSGGRGSRSGLDRPDFAIFDDLVANDRDAYSKAILEQIEGTIEGDVGSSLSGNNHFKIFIGTAYHLGDPICSRAVTGEAIPVVFPKAEVQPHGDIYNSQGELVKEAMKKENFVSVWEDRHSFEKQRKVYAQAEALYKKGNTKKLKTVDQEYYCRVTSEHEMLIPKSDIKYIDMTHIKEDARFYTWVITTDYTTTGNKSSDDSGAALIAIDHEENRYMVDMTLRKMTLNVQYANTMRLIELALSFGASSVSLGVEIDGQQSLHLIALERYFEKQNKSNILNFAVQKERDGKKVTWSGIKSKGSGDKLWRLKIEADFFHRGKYFINKDINVIENVDFDTMKREISNVTFSNIKSTDNGLDTISQLSLIDYDVPTMSADDAKAYLISMDEDELSYNNDNHVTSYNESIKY